MQYVGVLQDHSGRLHLKGKNWSVEMPHAGMAWSAKLYRADFDGNGQQDYWIQASVPSFQGRCHGEVNLAWLRFNAKGLPTLETAHSYGPLAATDQDGDGRAEFRITDCYGKVVAQWEEDPASVVPAPISDWDALRELRFGNEIPHIVVRDQADRRDIWIDNGLPALKAAMRDGCATQWRSSPRTNTVIFWIDTQRRLLPPAQVRAEYVITGTRRIPVGRIETKSECTGIAYDEARMYYCPSTPRWLHQEGGWRVSLAADWRTVRSAYTAMQHENVTETRFEPPPGARALLYGRSDFVQWATSAGLVLTLHDLQGKLLESKIEIATPGRLVGYEANGELAFWNGKQTVTLVKGELRWSR
jgi:hypothetical protein